MATPSDAGSSSRHGSLTGGVEIICERHILLEIIQDYLTRIYSLSPLVHKPTFAEDLASDRASRDPDFLAFLFALTSMTLVMLPARFLYYRNQYPTFPYSDVIQLISRCQESITSTRRQKWFEKPNHETAAISFMLAYTHNNVGMIGQASIYASELDAMMKKTGAQHAQRYKTLDNIQTQLLKKLWWMTFIWSVHDRLGNFLDDQYRWLPIPDTMCFDSRDLEQLLPVELDDEYIFPHHYEQHPNDKIPLCAGFNGIIRVYLCFVALPQQDQHRQNSAGYRVSGRSDVHILYEMFDRICEVPSALPQALRITEESSPDQSPNPTAIELDANKANIHVTQLWARYLIFDRLVSMQREDSEERLNQEEVDALASLVRSEHEAICDQLLQFLSSVNLHSLESNGPSISFKIRQVASLLLDYQATPGHEHSGSNHKDSWQSQRGLAERAQSYISQFLDLLTRLDNATFQDSQRLICMEAWERIHAEEGAIA